jgi:hypothetical protein
MKAVIDGKVYNTDTATLIGEASSRVGRNDFRWFSECLYQTKKGAFFLAGEGGPMSRWAEEDGNTTYGGSDVVVLTEAEALAWCEENDVDADEIAERFEVEEG